MGEVPGRVLGTALALLAWGASPGGPHRGAGDLRGSRRAWGPRLGLGEGIHPQAGGTVEWDGGKGGGAKQTTTRRPSCMNNAYIIYAHIYNTCTYI